MLFDRNFRLDRRLADLPLPAQPLPVSRESKNDKLALVVDSDCDSLRVEMPQPFNVLAALLRGGTGGRDISFSARVRICKKCASLLCETGNASDYVRQSAIWEFLQRDLLERLNKLVEVLHIRTERALLSRALVHLFAVRSSNGASHLQQLVNNRHSLEKIATVLLNSNSSGPVDGKCGKNRLSPRGSGCPPFDCLADQVKRRAVDAVRHVHINHGRSLALLEAQA